MVVSNQILSFFAVLMKLCKLRAVELSLDSELSHGEGRVLCSFSLRASAESRICLHSGISLTFCFLCISRLLVFPVGVRSELGCSVLT